jgi:hypothetical protein
MLQGVKGKRRIDDATRAKKALEAPTQRAEEPKA